MSSKPIVSIIAFHGGPAKHFAAFSKTLSDVQIDFYACEPALTELKRRQVVVLHPFCFDGLSSDEENSFAEQLAKSCSTSHAVLTDVGHIFSCKIHNLLSKYPNVKHLCYYDNLDSFVEGGYSLVAADVIRAASGVLLNPRLDHLYKEEGVEIEINNRVGIGFFPLEEVDQLRTRREANHTSTRTELLSHLKIMENNQKILVYFGGNNDRYFRHAFPGFLDILSRSIKSIDLSSFIIILQQHPRAIRQNFDGLQVETWKKENHHIPYAPQIFLSPFDSEMAQIFADGALYHQTTLAPQFCLLNIPTFQVADKIYPDILIRNDLVRSVTTQEALIENLQLLMRGSLPSIPKDRILDGLGIQTDWADRLRESLL